MLRSTFLRLTTSLIPAHILRFCEAPERLNLIANHLKLILESGSTLEGLYISASGHHLMDDDIPVPTHPTDGVLYSVFDNLVYGRKSDAMRSISSLRRMEITEKELEGALKCILNIESSKGLMQRYIRPDQTLAALINRLKDTITNYPLKLKEYSTFITRNLTASATYYETSFDSRMKAYFDGIELRPGIALKESDTQYWIEISVRFEDANPVSYNTKVNKLRDIIGYEDTKHEPPQLVVFASPKISKNGSLAKRVDFHQMFTNHIMGILHKIIEITKQHHNETTISLCELSNGCQGSFGQNSWQHRQALREANEEYSGAFRF